MNTCIRLVCVTWVLAPRSIGVQDDADKKLRKAVLHICRECDTAYAEVKLRHGEIARCRCCQAIVARHPHLNVDVLLAIAIACGIMFLIANFTPVLSIEVAGTHTEANVWEAVLSMGDGWISLAAVVLLSTMLIAPFAQVMLVIWLMSFAHFERRAPGFTTILSVLHALRPWSMSEVFLLGALVAIVKLSNFLPISTGAGVWALAALTVLLAILGRFDPESWWALGARDAV